CGGDAADAVKGTGKAKHQSVTTIGSAAAAFDAVRSHNRQINIKHAGTAVDFSGYDAKQPHRHLKRPSVTYEASGAVLTPDEKDHRPAGWMACHHCREKQTRRRRW